MPVEVWAWLRDSMAVRPHVVARVRLALASGDARPSADEVATAMICEPPWGSGSPYPADAVAS